MCSVGPALGIVSTPELRGFNGGACQVGAIVTGVCAADGNKG